MARPGIPQLVLFVMLLVVVSEAAPLQADDVYRLRAVLHPDAHVVEGSAELRWRNDSREPARELVFHLYLNAFADDHSVFWREGGARLRGVERRGRGSIELTDLTAGDGASLLGGAFYGAPEGDRTVLRVPLPEPIAPGRTRTLQLAFRAELPPLMARSGYSDRFHMVAQWFPKLAKREPDGQWAAFPYHGLGEFYADFARYEVSLQVPRGWTVAASGRRVEVACEPAGCTHRYVAAPVHDFAWAASPHFERLSLPAGTTRIEVLYEPGYGWAARRHGEIAQAALPRMQRHYGRYPYETLTIVVPPRHAAGAAGMEYPTLFVTGGSWLAVPSTALPMPLQDEVTTHELAHQWFQGLLASHELAHPFLDEGLTQWCGWDLMRQLFGASRSGGALGPLSFDVFERGRGQYYRGRDTPSSLLPAHRYANRTELARAVYLRPALLLEGIGRRWGLAQLRRTLGDYARRHRYRHPTPGDLYQSFDRHYGAGFSRRVLEPGLRGEHLDPALPPLAAPRGTPGRWWLPAMAWAQALLGLVGP